MDERLTPRWREGSGTNIGLKGPGSGGGIQNDGQAYEFKRFFQIWLKNLPQNW
jgi:hypothetical protein